MIRIPGRFIYLATPATASRTVSEVLIKQCGGEVLAATHHAHLSDMPLLDNYSEPVYTLIRDPYDYVLSRYFYKYRHAVNRSDQVLEAFIPKYSLESHSSPAGTIMQMYRGFVDRYFLFEDGIAAFFAAVGFPDVDIPTIGASSAKAQGPRLKIEDVSLKVKELINQHFADEVGLYQMVSGES